jgi:hypothetical protein
MADEARITQESAVAMRMHDAVGDRALTRRYRGKCHAAGGPKSQ